MIIMREIIVPAGSILYVLLDSVYILAFIFPVDDDDPVGSAIIYPKKPHISSFHLSCLVFVFQQTLPIYRRTLFMCLCAVPPVHMQ